MRPITKVSGFTLLEMILVLVVISAILIATFVFYPRVRDAAQSKTEADLMKSIAGEVRRLYPMRNYSPLTSGDLLGGGAVPEGFQTPPTSEQNSAVGSVLSNRWGATIEVYPSLADGTPVPPSATGNVPFFTVRYWGASPGLCRSMVAQLLGFAEAVIVDDGAVNDDFRVVKNTYENIEADGAATALGCQDVDGVNPRVMIVSD